jgi:hypothetical protein
MIEDCSGEHGCDESECSDIKMYGFDTRYALNYRLNGCCFKFKDNALMQKVGKIADSYRKQSLFMYLYALSLFYLFIVPLMRYHFVMRADT